MTDEQHVSDDDDGYDEYDMASGDVPMGIRSGFSVRTRRPFVELMVGTQHIEMPVKTAMELAWSTSTNFIAAVTNWTFGRVSY